MFLMQPKKIPRLCSMQATLQDVANGLGGSRVINWTHPPDPSHKKKKLKYPSSGGASSPIFAMRSLKTRSRRLDGSNDDMRSGSLRDPEPNLHLPQKTGNILNHLTPNFCKLICVNKTHKRHHPNNSSNYRTSSLLSFFGFLSKGDPYP